MKTERQRPAGAAHPSHSPVRLRLRRAAVGLAVAGLLAAAPRPAAAQNATLTNADTIDELITGLFTPPEFQPVFAGTAEQQAAYKQRLAASKQGIAVGIGNALASYPLGASSAGFTYTTNPTTGERELRAVTFGPVFVERALTNGKGVFNFGFAYQGAHFDSLQGRDVKNEGFVVQSQRGTYVSDGSDVGDTWRGYLDMDSSVFLFSGSYGLTGNLDLGWSVPIVSLSARGQFIRDYNGGKDYDLNLSVFDPATNRRSFIRDAYPNKIGQQTLVDKTIKANGIGDVVVRAKYAAGPMDGQRVLVSGDLRLPTGDEENLIGAGKASFRTIVGTSRRLGESASINANGGFTAGGLTDEINFSIGAEVATLPAKQLTLTFDFIGQNLRDAITDIDNVVTYDQVQSNLADGFLPRRVQISTETWNRGATTLLRGAIGAKYALGGNWLLTGSALFRLNENGFQAKVVPFIGLEHTWAPSK